MRSGDVAALHLNFGVRRRCVAIFTVWPLSSQERALSTCNTEDRVGLIAGLDI
jgi:hypothetical protein